MLIPSCDEPSAEDMDKHSHKRHKAVCNETVVYFSITCVRLWAGADLFLSLSKNEHIIFLEH